MPTSGAAALLLFDDVVETGTPTVVVPDVVLNYIWRRDAGDTGDGTRIGTATPNGSFVDWYVASGKTYEYRAEAVGENGVSAFGDWASG